MPGEKALADDGLLNECKALFDGHYGKWGSAASRPGEPVRLNRGQLRESLGDPDSSLACARHDGQLVGYCVVLRFALPDGRRVAWVAQLVVAEAHRHAGVATRLLYSVWQFSTYYAWGLLTANPLAVRALQSATRRPCSARLIAGRGPEIAKALHRRLTWVPEDLVRVGGRAVPRADTCFLLDHSEVPRLRKHAARQHSPWSLGDIAEGEEWFACTFKDQSPGAPAAGRLAELLRGSDEMWVRAYEGMTLDASHGWHVHHPAEVAHVRALVPAARTLLDIGAGDGRHAVAFAGLGLEVTAVDISARLLDQARARTGGELVRWHQADARRVLPPGPFDAIVCLYDVVGSSADLDDDLDILRHAKASVSPTGTVVLSVMNATPTLAVLPKEHLPSTTAALLQALERLPASTTMQSTGNVFDPETLVHHEGVFYRKEQFDQQSWRLPVETIIRDRRYTVASIGELCRRAGLRVLHTTPVQSGQWDRTPPLDKHDPRAKELLVVAVPV